MSEDAFSVVRAWFAALNRSDVAALAALYAEDATFDRDAGVLLVRTPGTAARIPAWVDEDPGLPRVRSAGRWLKTPGRLTAWMRTRPLSTEACTSASS